MPNITIEETKEQEKEPNSKWFAGGYYQHTSGDTYILTKTDRLFNLMTGSIFCESCSMQPIDNEDFELITNSVIKLELDENGK